MLYTSKPQQVETVQWTGDNRDEIESYGGGKVAFGPSWDVHAAGPRLTLLAGRDGAQEWVPVPVGHWLVCQPGDKSDIWPVDPEYFANKYFVADWPRVPPGKLPDYEYAVMLPAAHPDEPHRGPESLAWCRDWVSGAEADGFKPGMFYIARRTVGPWERFQ